MNRKETEMAFGTEDLLKGLRSSRLHFLKHLKGLTAEQWTWKPYPECKSILDTVIHLVVDDRAALQALETGGEPEYENLITTAVMEAGASKEKAVEMLEESHERLCAYIAARFTGVALDSDFSAFGSKTKLGAGIPILSSEDYYHAGQVAYIRMATDPSWDYYSHIYSGD